MPFDLIEAALLLDAPGFRHLIEERSVDAPIELVVIGCAKTAEEPVGFRLQARDGGLVLFLLVGMALVKGTGHPAQHLIVETQFAEELGELLAQGLLADVRAWAFLPVAGAVVVDVLALLHLADHRTAAVAAADEPGEGEVPLGARLHLAGKAAVEDVLHAVPEFARHQRFVPTGIGAAFPVEVAGVDALAQNAMDVAGRDARAGARIGQARRMGLLRRFLHRHRAGRIPLEELRNETGNARIGDDAFLAVGERDVDIAERREAGPDALFGLLLHALPSFFGEIVDIILRHQHLDAVHELFRRARVLGEHDAFLDEMDLDIEVVERHPVAQIAIKAVGLFNQQDARGRMRPHIPDELFEIGAAALLGRLDIDEFFRDGDALRFGVAAQQLQLRGDREAFLLLFLRRDTCVDQRGFGFVADAGIGGRLLVHREPAGWMIVFRRTREFCRSRYPMATKDYPWNARILCGFN